MKTALLKPTGNNIKIGNTTIEWSNTIKYLGIIFDQKLLFRDHINNLITKCIIFTKTLYPLINRISKLSQINKLAIY